MSNIFEIIDKTGRKIYLSKERLTHITSPISPHAYMTNYLEEIKQTITKPDKIVSSINDGFKVNYYKFYKQQRKYLRVIIKYLNGRGFIISAYFVKNISK